MSAWLPPNMLKADEVTVSVVSEGTETVSRMIGLGITRVVSGTRIGIMSNSNIVR